MLLTALIPRRARGYMFCRARFFAPCLFLIFAFSDAFLRPTGLGRWIGWMEFCQTVAVPRSQNHQGSVENTDGTLFASCVTGVGANETPWWWWLMSLKIEKLSSNEFRFARFMCMLLPGGMGVTGTISSSQVNCYEPWLPTALSGTN